MEGADRRAQHPCDVHMLVFRNHESPSRQKIFWSLPKSDSLSGNMVPSTGRNLVSCGIDWCVHWWNSQSVLPVKKKRKKKRRGQCLSKQWLHWVLGLCCSSCAHDISWLSLHLLVLNPVLYTHRVQSFTGVTTTFCNWTKSWTWKRTVKRPSVFCRLWSL